MLWSAIRLGSGVKEDISIMQEKLLVTGDAAYIPSELSELLARCVCSDIGLCSVPDLFVRAGVPPVV